MLLSQISAIKRYGRLMKFGIVLISLFLAGGTVFFVYATAFAPELLVDWIQQNLLGDEIPVTLTPATLLVLSLIGSLNLILLFNGLISLWNLCNCLNSGDVFAPDVGHWLRKSGGYALSCAICQFFSKTIAIVAVTINNPDGQRYLTIRLDSDIAFLVVVSGLLMVMGHIMMIASDVDAENREFI